MLDKLMGKLMADTRASEIYQNIDASDPARKMADLHKLAMLEGDKSRALAYEYHVRTLATIGFHNADVLEALQQVERNLHIRKMGKGGSADHKMIARNIRENYHLGWFTRLDDGRIQFHIDGLKVRCKDMPGSVEQVARKFERGYRRKAVRA